jgi:hypothetical protein
VLSFDLSVVSAFIDNNEFFLPFVFLLFQQLVEELSLGPNSLMNLPAASSGVSITATPIYSQQAAGN